VKLQVQKGRKYRTIIGSLALIFREEGVRGLYRGLAPTLIALPPNWAIYFCTYEAFRGYLVESDRAKGAGEGKRTEGGYSEMTVNALSATVAGLVTCVSTNPLWVVKTRLQAQGRFESSHRIYTKEYKSTLGALLRIAREEGYRGLYSGLSPSIFGVANVAIMLPLYEELKGLAARRLGKGKNELQAGELAASSALAKAVASSITYPHEVVRSRMQISGRCTAILSTCGEVYREGGLRAFYRGCATNLTRTMPTAAVTFTSFEIISRNLDFWFSK